MTYTIPEVHWESILPVIIVISTGVLALILEMLRPKQNNNGVVLVSLVGLIAAMAFLVPQIGSESIESFGAMVFRDGVSVILQIILVGACFLTFCFSEGYLREKRIPFAEFYPLALWATSGAMLMVLTNSLMMLFIGLEVMSIALYCLSGMAKNELRSEESAMKYFLLGAFASAFLLFGMAFVYGATGSLSLSAVSETLTFHMDDMGVIMMLGVGLILVGFCFKASLVPFHQWTPDVYQGAPTNVTAFMSAIAKIAAFGALYRVLAGAFPLMDFWFPLLVMVAIVTMTVGNLAALVQQDVKRTLGYSAIAQAGYLLVALLSHFRNPEAVSLNATLYYLLVYSTMTLGAFAVISMVARQGREGTRLRDLNGLWSRSPLAAVALAFCMLSLIGIPPTAGFVGKLFIFNDALAAGLPLLAIALAVNSVISVFYYLGIMKAAFVTDENLPQGESAPAHVGMGFVLSFSVVAMIGFAVFVAPVSQVFSRATGDITSYEVEIPEPDPDAASPAAASLSAN